MRLNSGRDVPIIGLGLGGLRTGGPPQGNKAKEIVRLAIAAGYRHLDTAFLYGNEVVVGQAINEAIADGDVTREELFVSTKIHSNKHQLKSRDEAVLAIMHSVQNLNLTYVDQMLIHMPSNDSHMDLVVWKALEDALNLGLVRSIGVSNFNVMQLSQLIKSADVLPAMNQVESYPGKSQWELIRYCSAYKTRITAYSPLGAGTLINNTRIVAIGEKYGKSAPQVMIRWQIQRGVVVISHQLDSTDR